MGYTDNMSPEMKQRIVQELVPGKQISLAHIIANPEMDQDPAWCKESYPDWQ